MKRMPSDCGSGSNLPRAVFVIAITACLWLARVDNASAQSVVGFCPGDGTGLIGNCPCGPTQNGSPLNGCMNSSGSSGLMLSAGNPCVSVGCGPETLGFGVSGLPASVLTVLIQGTAEVSPGVFLADGIRCVGGQIKRLYNGAAVNGSIFFPPIGGPSISERSAALGDVFLPGTTRYYQTYYRDPASFCTAGTYNMTNGHIVVWR